jgi:hypothetical protein
MACLLQTYIYSKQRKPLLSGGRQVHIVRCEELVRKHVISNSFILVLEEITFMKKKTLLQAVGIVVGSVLAQCDFRAALWTVQTTSIIDVPGPLAPSGSIVRYTDMRIHDKGVDKESNIQLFSGGGKLESSSGMPASSVPPKRIDIYV